MDSLPAEPQGKQTTRKVLCFLLTDTLLHHLQQVEGICTFAAVNYKLLGYRGKVFTSDPMAMTCNYWVYKWTCEWTPWKRKLSQNYFYSQANISHFKWRRTKSKSTRILIVRFNSLFVTFGRVVLSPMLFSDSLLGKVESTKQHSNFKTSISKQEHLGFWVKCCWWICFHIAHSWALISPRKSLPWGEQSSWPGRMSWLLSRGFILGPCWALW